MIKNDDDRVNTTGSGTLVQRNPANRYSEWGFLICIGLLAFSAILASDLSFKEIHFWVKVDKQYMCKIDFASLQVFEMIGDVHMDNDSVSEWEEN